MAFSGWMIFTDDDKLYNGFLYETKMDCVEYIENEKEFFPLLRCVGVEVHPKDEIIRFHEG